MTMIPSLPLLEAFAGSQPAVEHGQLVAEAAAQPRHDLVGQADLGDQHERLPAGAQRGPHSAQVDLGLAAARYAVEQERLGSRGRDGSLDRLQRTRLIGAERDAAILLEGDAQHVARCRSLVHGHEPAARELAHQAPGEGRGECVEPRLAGLGQAAQQCGLSRRPGEASQRLLEVDAGRQRGDLLPRDAGRRSAFHLAALHQAVVLQGPETRVGLRAPTARPQRRDALGALLEGHHQGPGLLLDDTRGECGAAARRQREAAHDARGRPCRQRRGERRAEHVGGCFA
jgi:hypothetical protein